MTSNDPDDVVYIYRRYIRHNKTGELMDAWKYGRKAWRIPIRKDGDKDV